MKIAVKVTIEMTPVQIEEYCLANGLARSEVREDVRTQIRTIMQECEAFGSGGADVTATAR